MRLTTQQLGTIASLAVGDNKFQIVWLAKWKPWIMEWEIISTNCKGKLYAILIDKRLNINASIHLKRGVFAKEDVLNQVLIHRYLEDNGFLKK